MSALPRCSVYNGTVLPNKPSFDATKYPNWMILYGTNSTTGSKQYIWLACSKPFLKYAESVYVFPADSEIIGYGANVSTCTWYSGTITKEEGLADYYTFSGTYVWSFMPIYSYSDPTVVAHNAGDMVTDWDAEEPTITALTGAGTAESPTGYWKGDTATALVCSATVSDGGTLSYKWYRNGTYVASGSSYTPSTATAGTFLYQCTVTNTRTAASGFSDVDTVQSDILAIVVTAKEDPDTPDTPVVPEATKASNHKHIIGYVLKQCGVPMAELIAEMLGKVKKTASLYLYGTPSTTGNIGLRNGESVTMYDGAVLPPLPESDMPYATIGKHLYYPDDYRLIFSTKPFKKSSGIISVIDTSVSVLVSDYNADTGEWGALNPYTVNTYTFQGAFWSNYDELNADGSVHRAKSDPIPIYKGLVDEIDGIPIYE